MIEKRYAVESEISVSASSPRRLTGLIPYNSPAQIGRMTERLKPGVFRRTLQNRESNPVRLLIEHGEGGGGVLALATYPGGGLELRETPDGLEVAADIDATDPDWLRIAPKIKRRVLRGLSFSFQMVKEDRHGSERDLYDVDLFEVSIVGSPAYSASTVAVRKNQQANYVAEAQAAARERHLYLLERKLKERR